MFLKLHKYCKLMEQNNFKFICSNNYICNNYDLLFVYRKTLFDAHPEDPDYTPPPEDRPGGFNWGQEANMQ